MVVGGGGGGGSGFGGKVVVDEVVLYEVVLDEVVDEVVEVVEVSLQVLDGSVQFPKLTKGSWSGIEMVISAVKVLKELSVSLSARILVLNVPLGTSKLYIVLINH